MRRVIPRQSFLLLIILFVATTAQAQVENAEVVGTITDSSNAVIAGAKVVLRSMATNIERATTTDARGNYSFPGVRIGEYEVTASHPGFQTAKASGVTVRVGDRLRVDLSLAPGTVAQEITVTGEQIPLLETDTSSKSTLFLGQQIRELPLNKRDYTQLALLAPGALREVNHRLGGAMNINGNRALQNNYLLDGADNNSNATSFRGERVDVIRPSVDALAEFKVQTNSYSAEYGRSAGAVINATIKSGSNELHGAAWEFFRNDALDAHGWTPTLGGRKRELRFNQFGANVGGPIKREKTFFFVNYEGERERSVPQTYIRTLPSLALQNGDFNNIDPGTPSDFRGIPRDPMTGQPFSGNIIPRDRWDRVSAKILADPNFPKPNVLRPTDNFISSPVDRIRTDKFDVRIDQNFSQRWRMFGRYSFSDLKRFRPGPFQGLAEGADNDAFGTTATRGQNAVLGVTTAWTPGVIGEFRFGYTRLGANVFPVNFGSPPVIDLLGIPNTPNAPNINGGWPKFRVDGMSDFGRATSNPQFQIPNVFLLNYTLTQIRGAHTLKTGFDGQRIDTAIMDVSATIGSWRFRNNRFANNAWADFLLGLPGVIRLTTPTTAYHQIRIYNLFVQDDYRMRRNLTLNLGLRYEYSNPIREKHNLLGNFDRQNGRQVFAKDGDAADRATVQPDRTNFAPRVGFAYTASRRLVVRSAFGLFYNHTNRQGREGLLSQTHPFVIDLNRSQSQPQYGTPALITLQGGFPQNFFSLASPADYILRGNDPTLRSAYTMQFNFTLQYQLAREWLLDVGYLGNRGRKLTRFYEGNQASVPGPSSNLASRRPFPNFGDVQFMDSGGISNYNALQAKLEKRWSSGLSLVHAFTWARALDTVSAWGESQSGGDIVPQDAYNFRNERGMAGTGVKLNSVVNWVYELPLGRGRKYGANLSRPINYVVGGWELSGIWTWRSGVPLTVSSSECGPCVLTTDNRVQRGDVVPGVSPSLDHRTPEKWFNTAAFKPASSPYGTAGRDTVYGPGLNNWDMSFAKSIPLTETKNLQFRAEMFNIFNQVNLDRPNANASGGSSFGRITTALPGRSIQFGLKFYW